VPRLLAVPLLAAIPIGRVCPELPCLLRPGNSGANPPLRPTLVRAGACLLAVLLAFLSISAARRWMGFNQPSPPSHRSRSFGGGGGFDRHRWVAPPPSMLQRVDCPPLGGHDCSDVLTEWAGLENCAVLAATDGTCESYCGSRGRTCVKAMDDSGTGACTLQEGGRHQQTEEGDGCLQDWKTQICVCSGFDRPPPSSVPEPQEQEDEHGSREVDEEPGSALDDAGGDWEEVPTPHPDRLEEAQAKGQEKPARVAPCYLQDSFYEPLNMPGQGRTIAQTPEQCQRRCARTPGCARFSWWADGGCHLHEFRSSRRSSAPGEAIAGPSSCEDEAELDALIRDLPPTTTSTTSRTAAVPTRPRPRTSDDEEEPFPVWPEPERERKQPVGRPSLPKEGSPSLVFLVALFFVALAFSGLLE